MARARGWPTIRIVRSMSSGLTYGDALKLARKAAPLLELVVIDMTILFQHLSLEAFAVAGAFTLFLLARYSSRTAFLSRL